MILSFKSYGAPELDLQKIFRKTIVSITRETEEKFTRLKNKESAIIEAEKQYPVLREEMKGLQDSLLKDFEELRWKAISEYRKATGFSMNRKKGYLWTERDFSRSLEAFYKNGLEALQKTRRRASEEIFPFIDEIIPLVEQRIKYYGDLRDVYGADIKNFFVEVKNSGRDIFLRSFGLLFLAPLVEEERDMLEALNLLKKFPSPKEGDPEKCPSRERTYEIYTSPLLTLLRDQVKGELTPPQLQEICASLQPVKK